MSSSIANSTEIKKLTKTLKSTGATYSRRAEVEAQLESVVRLDKTEAFGFLNNRVKGTPNYLFDETLVYLLREAFFRNDRPTVETLYAELTRRTLKLLSRFYSKFPEKADFADFVQSVEIRIIEKIFDAASDSSDYAQINFGDFAVTEALVVWRGLLRKINRETALFRTTEPENEDGELREIEFKAADISPEDKAILREGLSKLPQNIRNAAVLILDGWQIESLNEDEPTISKIMNVSSRTIRNWLKEARQILAGYEGEIRR